MRGHAGFAAPLCALPANTPRRLLPPQVALEGHPSQAESARGTGKVVRPENLRRAPPTPREAAEMVLPRAPYAPSPQAGAWWHELRCDPVGAAAGGAEDGAAAFDDGAAKVGALRRAVDAAALLVRTGTLLLNARRPARHLG